MKKEEAGKAEGFPRLPELPKLPELPDLNDMNLPKLPSFPRSSLGDKFSQNTIKDAVAGGKESDEGFDADEFAVDEDEEMQMMQKPFQRKILKKMDDDNEFRQFQKFERKTMESPSFGGSRAYRKEEPIFIRLDKFEESIKIFEKMKQQVSDIEGVLREIKITKEQEEKELQFWEQEIQNMKKQIDKVEKDIFSKVE
ncbi:MAG: hypothetical protein WD876_01325 [Candidatus Pacearchaeota archaeon]